MIEQHGFQQGMRSTSSQEAAADGDTVVFITYLVEQNAILTNRLNQLTSQNALAKEIIDEALEEADRIVSESISQAEALKTLTESEAKDRAVALMMEAHVKANAEASRILAEAREQSRLLYPLNKVVKRIKK